MYYSPPSIQDIGNINLILPYKMYYSHPSIYITLFIVHSNNTSSQHSVCSQGADNQTILYLYSLFIYMANEVAQSVR